LRIDSIAALPADFTQTIYRKIETTEGRVRWNPNTITENEIRTPSYEKEPVFKVAELQQMSDPLVFIRKTIDQYPELNIDELVADFKEIEDEIRKGDMQK
jgi:exonuclease SbcD